jgi:hypothetical protein
VEKFALANIKSQFNNGNVTSTLVFESIQILCLCLLNCSSEGADSYLHPFCFLSYLKLYTYSYFLATFPAQLMSIRTIVLSVDVSIYSSAGIILSRSGRVTLDGVWIRYWID